MHQLPLCIQDERKIAFKISMEMTVIKFMDKLFLTLGETVLIFSHFQAFDGSVQHLQMRISDESLVQNLLIRKPFA